MNYGKAIRICRAASNLQQAELAEGAGISSSHLSLIESGKRRPSLETLELLCKYLSIPLHLVVLLAAEPAEVKKGRARDLNRVAQDLLEALASSASSRS